MGNSSWRVTEEIKSQTKVFMGLYIFDFFFLIVYIGLTYLLRNLVHQDLRIAYYIFQPSWQFSLRCQARSIRREEITRVLLFC